MRLEKLESILARWNDTPPTSLAVASIQTHLKFQPRAIDIAPVRDRRRLEEDSDRHIAKMRAVLEANTTDTLEPVLLANIDGVFYVADGHHRLSAYRLAGRQNIPARAIDIDAETAALAAKLANCGREKLTLHREQAADAAWQYLAHITARGHLPSSNVSLRAVAGRFGIGKTTVSRMLNRIPEVDLREFAPDTCDPATRWPRWRQVKGNAMRDAFANVPLETRQQHRAEKLAARILKQLDEAGPEVARMAAEVIRRDAAEYRAEAIADAVDEWTGVPADY